MTGPFDRLRAWVGSFFGGTAESDDEDGPASEASTGRVVHRDDRPLETPSTMDRPDPPTPGTESEDERQRIDIPDAEGGDVTTTADSAAPTSSDEQAPSTPAASDGEADAAFTCSVCGTAVDDPSEPCPLCRSTEVVPASEREDDSAAPTRGGRTSVSTADDEAVDRLRDVEDEG